MESLKPGLDLNANRMGMRTQHAKTKPSINVDELPRQGKQHSAVRGTFCEQPNAICQLPVLQREFTYNTLCRSDSLSRRMPNSVRMYHTFCLISHPHASFAFAFRCKLGLRLRLCLNANRTRMWHAKTKPLFNVDVLPRRPQTAFGCATTIQQTDECYPSTVGTSNRIHIQYVYVGSICCLGVCWTVYKCTIRSASPLVHMRHSHSHWNVNPA